MGQSKNFTEQYLKLFLAAAALLGGAIYVLYLVLLSTGSEQTRESQQQLSTLLVTQAQNRFVNIARDLKLLRDNPSLQAYLQAPNRETQTASQAFFDVFLLSSPQYFQVRFIDAKGMEILRSDLHRDVSQGLKPPVPFSDKSQRYYFREAAKLNANQIYVSRFDLNVEHNEIERPIRPTLRFALPVYKDETLQGVVTLNFDGQQLIDHLKSRLDQHTGFWLTTRDGQLLQSPNPFYNWSNVFQTGQQQTTLKTVLPEFAEDIEKPDFQGTIRVGDRLASSAWLSLSSVHEDVSGLAYVPSQDEPWRLILTTDLDTGALQANLLDNLITLYLGALLLAAIVILYHTRVSQREMSASRDLQDSQILVKTLFANAPAALYIKDRDGAFLQANPITEQILQCKAADVIGKTVHDLYDPDTSQQLAVNDARVLREGVVLETDEQITDKNTGTVREFHSVKFPLRDSNDHIAGLAGISMEVTDLKASERRAIENEELFTTLFNQHSNKLILLDAEGHILMANAPALRVCELSAEEILGKPFESVEWWPGNRGYQSLLAKLLEKARSEGQAREEISVTSRHNAERIVDLTVRAIYDAEGIPYQFLVEGRDITDRVKAERELRRNNMIMSALSYAQTAYIRNTSSNVLFSRMLEDILQLSGSAYGFIGEILHHEDGRPYMRTYAVSNITWDEEGRKLYDEYKGRGFVFENLNSLYGEVVKTGTLLISNDPQHDPRSSGTPEGHPEISAFMGMPIYNGDSFIGIIGLANRSGGYTEEIARHLKPVVDVCGSIIHGYQANLAQQQSREALYASEQRFRDVLDAAPDAILIVDEEGLIQLANNQAKTLFGYEQHELLGKPVEILVPREFHAVHHTHRQKFYKEATHRQMAPGLRELCARCKDGSMIPVDISLAVDNSGAEPRVICSVRDIREKKNIEQHLRQSQKIEAIGQLTGGIAHDFNNLLGIIIGNADMALEVDMDLDAMRMRVNKIIETAEKGAGLTRHLLAFSRSQKLDAESTVVNDLIVEMQSMLPRTLGPDITIDTDLQNDLWPVLIDKNELESALLNLSINARDAMPQGGKLVFETENVSLHGEIRDFDEDIKPGDYVCISISDTGTGIPKKDIERVFEPFFTTKDVGAGTGLGLAMVFGFVKQSKGYIKLYSELGIGTSFRIYLPRDAGYIQESEDEPADTDDAAALTGTETILVVDDELDMLNYTANSLKRQGYTVLEANNGDEAIRILQENPDIRLLVSDIVMPGEMNGIALGKKASDTWPDLKIIFVSGFPRNMLDSKGELNFPYRLMSKPYRADELKKTVREMLDESDS